MTSHNISVVVHVVTMLWKISVMILPVKKLKINQQRNEEA